MKTLIIEKKLLSENMIKEVEKICKPMPSPDGSVKEKYLFVKGNRYWYSSTIPACIEDKEMFDSWVPWNDEFFKQQRYYKEILGILQDLNISITIQPKLISSETLTIELTFLGQSVMKKVGTISRNSLDQNSLRIK